MTFLRSLFVDLVDKKLWPVALVLLVGLIAVPVVLSKAPPKVPVEKAVSSAPAISPVPPLTGTVSLNTGEKGGTVSGSAHDPFAQQGVPKPVTASGPTSTTADSTSSSGPPETSSSGGTTTTTEEPKPASTVDAVVRFGLSGATRRKSELPVLAPLPSASNPVIIYLGRGSDGVTAQFLVSSDVKPTGDGRCSPTASICSTLYLKPGQTEYLDVLDSSHAAPQQYQLDLIGYVDQ